MHVPEPARHAPALEGLHAIADPEVHAFLQRILLEVGTAPVLLSYVDREERCAFINSAYEQWLGQTYSEVCGRLLIEILGEIAYETARPLVRRALAGEHIRYELVLPSKEGEPRRAQVQLIPHLAAEGAVAGYCALSCTIRVESEPGVRTPFTVELPVS
jgi:PAS domain S-box-containing protein